MMMIIIMIMFIMIKTIQRTSFECSLFQDDDLMLMSTTMIMSKFAQN